MIRKAIKNENVSRKKCSFNDAYFLSSIEMGHCRRSSPAFKSLPKILWKARKLEESFGCYCRQFMWHSLESVRFTDFIMIWTNHFQQQADLSHFPSLLPSLWFGQKGDDNVGCHLSTTEPSNLTKKYITLHFFRNLSLFLTWDIIGIQYKTSITKGKCMKCIVHVVWKSQKKSHSTLRSKRATFTFWVDKS